MTLKELKDYFGSSYAFEKSTKFSHMNYANWEKRGYIPINSQIKIEKITKGKLKANLNHLNQNKYLT